VRPSPVLVYTSLRLGIFVVTLGLLYWLGMRQLLLLIVAVLVSGLLSYVLLGRQRDAMSASVARRGANLRQRLQESTESEDEADDAMRAEEQAQAQAERAAGDRPARSAQGEPEADQDGER
jgi:biopolymer transport protein ExbB/TolQ